MDGVSMIQISDSSLASEIGYDPTEQYLYIRFKNTGKVFRYRDFGPADWESFKNASSIGKFYHAHIRGVFTGEQVE